MCNQRFTTGDTVVLVRARVKAGPPAGAVGTVLWDEPNHGLFVYFPSPKDRRVRDEYGRLAGWLRPWQKTYRLCDIGPA